MSANVEIVEGNVGQFDVEHEGEVIATRERGFFKRLLGGGWPEAGEVIETLKRRTVST